ncbi:uncharacterized protein LOC6728907 [Drosophila simulans]|uniref:GD20855 n=2 Tax=melanogaster subgroup TaxID=32351 RepID=B4QY03_DROSI|nr:uncharacterized protein LOC6728907 [Drosophila simulans]XP_016035600.1 uncharacterized protein LOC6728907 [Drosophila simulans]XP_033167183.1 uncharacterized protein LOC117145585 [Drosophila mauritiana]XP_033167184.1 uncharacterized protein LOC117145585 [Drosophila mauritiana]XP_039151426.1 uncharacterized protein LOC6728907 [Drosophila simulans]EDX13740.1 GD20855 [Drosophila simulans]KMZ04863.1 uncharacterized protein Dsimw501_GD20855, isoform A [Drosophila simulans]KMZ04864.1 uncharacte
MQKPHHGLCWMLLLLASLIATFMLAFSYWMFVPREESLWSMISNNYSGGSGIKYSLPPAAVPEELKLRQRPPFVYQILH